MTVLPGWLSRLRLFNLCSRRYSAYVLAYISGVSCKNLLGGFGVFLLAFFVLTTSVQQLLDKDFYTFIVKINLRMPSPDLCG